MGQVNLPSRTSLQLLPQHSHGETLPPNLHAGFNLLFLCGGGGARQEDMTGGVQDEDVHEHDLSTANFHTSDTCVIRIYIYMYIYMYIYIYILTYYTYLLYIRIYVKKLDIIPTMSRNDIQCQGMISNFFLGID